VNVKNKNQEFARHTTPLAAMKSYANHAGRRLPLLLVALLLGAAAVAAPVRSSRFSVNYAVDGNSKPTSFVGHAEVACTSAIWNFSRVWGTKELVNVSSVLWGTRYFTGKQHRTCAQVLLGVALQHRGVSEGAWRSNIVVSPMNL
jgi:hypothetical protein